METFYDFKQQFDWNTVRDSIMSKTQNDVIAALSKQKRTLEDFKALVSPAADSQLEEMAKISHYLTRKRFGNTIQFYVPLYLSNACTNQCVYCGFNTSNMVHRVTLTPTQVLDEVKAIKDLGFGHILLVTGEHPAQSGFEYMKEIVALIRPHFHSVSAEIAPMQVNEYLGLIQEGLDAVYIYQETYHEANYRLYHPGGKKADFRYRLETPDRLGMAGIYKTGLGFLVGLEDWRTEAFFAALHIHYLEKKYWRTRYSLSLPRLRPYTGQFAPKHPATDRNLLQLILAFRIYNEELELSLSTRETPTFRNNIFSLGITLMSAGSKTTPGGYANKINDLEQFSVNDDRTAQEVQDMVKSHGYEVVWKDWDQCMTNQKH